MSLKKKVLYPLSLWLAPFIFQGLTRLIYGSCRVREIGRENVRLLEAGGRPYIAALWHYGVFFVVHRSQGLKWVAMVSGSKDGEYIARILKRIGIATVRGSRGKGGIQALKGMTAAIVDEGHNGVIVADGSQGPARKVQAGVILLASRTGVPILPVCCAADRYWAFRSWDRTVLPKPFSRIIMTYGLPLSVPEGLKSGDLERFRLELEGRLNLTYDQAWGAVGRREH
ncbi:MAG: lysophospholipid acyltransferase family protein [Proteobacteria bacterium]|nr:lysophospholipid acyltransferase family protein [Pseudomonadota bacterium]MBU1688419.1 lysophospholipid acyltransferase family protein [Pseudomonadota bacterium]